MLFERLVSLFSRRSHADAAEPTTPNKPKTDQEWNSRAGARSPGLIARSGRDKPEGYGRWGEDDD